MLHPKIYRHRLPVFGSTMEKKNKRILVVEDDPDIREIMTIILEMEGYQVCGLGDGKLVIPELKEKTPDLILLDVMLGDTNGIEICRQIKEDAEMHTIPVMIVSATHGHRNPGEENCNADEFLSKPFDVSELVSKVNKLAA